MTKEQIAEIVRKQQQYFSSGETLSVQTRIAALKKLRQAVKDNEEIIAQALKQDLGKSAFESYMCETGLVLSEISYMLRHIRSYAREKTVYTPLAQFASRSYKKPMPYGVTLIMSPWNYPLLLTLDPLVDALAAGNTAVIKPSAYSPATSQVIKDILEDIFPEEYVAVVTGGREENTYLLDQKFDYIFFTGSKAVGQTVLEKASKYITPVTLELGGKSPCIVHRSANLKLAAKRIVFGKYLNCGQTCVAPDYIYCEASIKDEFVSCVKEEIAKQYGARPLDNANYGKIISEKHFDRIVSLIDTNKTIAGGKYDRSTCRIEPTVLDHITWDDAVMKEEIFGPVMPILTFESVDQVIDQVNSCDKPLALYIFAEDKSVIKKVTSRCAYGGGCVNDVVIHLATSNMGFGGVGESGMGAYHGKIGFDTFTHYKSMVDKKTWMDLPMRYQPYKTLYRKLLNMFLR
jgi:aldehyde dehydrogenase (NAD+)